MHSDVEIPQTYKGFICTTFEGFILKADIINQ